MNGQPDASGQAGIEANAGLLRLPQNNGALDFFATGVVVSQLHAARDQRVAEDIHTPAHYRVEILATVVANGVASPDSVKHRISVQTGPVDPEQFNQAVVSVREGIEQARIESRNAAELGMGDQSAREAAALEARPPQTWRGFS